MKKNFLILASIFTLLVFVNNAKASCDGLYIAGRAGIVNHNLGDNSQTFGKRLEIDDNAFIAGGSVGYRWGYFRIEAEGMWRDKTSKEWGGSLKSKADFQTISYMANLYYDFSPYTMFTPYIMAGIGVSHIEYTFTGGGASPEKYETDNFTWAVGAGISAKMTNRFNIDIGYRFLNMDEIEYASIRAHEVYLGLRYTFPY